MATAVLKLDARGVSGQLKSLDKDFDGLDQSIVGTSGSLDRLSQDLQRFGSFAFRHIGAAAITFVDINRELEKQSILLTGVTGSASAGSEAFKDLIEFASEAPFTLTALTDSFTRLTISGIDPMDGSMRALSDAIAAFGGGSDDMKFATLAIQQMAAKGVISMEELRRQLAERIPSAVHDMAEGLGLTYRELVDKVSSGNQDSLVAIDAMLTVFANKYSGAGARLMDSYDGALRQVRLRRDVLLKDIADAGIWDELVDGLQSASKVLERWHVDPAFQASIQSMSDSMVEMINILVESEDEIVQFFDDFAKGIPDTVSGIASVSAEIINIAGNLRAVTGSLESIGGPEALEWGVIGYLLFKGKAKAAAIVGALVTVNKLMGLTGNSIGDMVKKGQDFWSTFTASMDHFTGKVDKETGLFAFWHEDYDKFQKELKRIEANSSENLIEVGIVIKAEDLKEDISTSLKEVEAMSKQGAQVWLEEYEKSYSKGIKKYTKTITEAGKDISILTQNFNDEIRSLARTGMTDQKVWDDITAQIEEYAIKAADAAEAGKWKEQEEILIRIKNLISSRPDEIREVVTGKDVDNARKVWEYQNRITRGGRSAYGDAKDPYVKAKKNYESLLRSQKQGYRVVKAGEDTLKVKVKDIKDINDAIIVSKEKQLEITKADKNAMKSLLKEYEEIAKGARTSTGELESKVDEVGVAWIEVGGVWTRVSKGIVGELEGLNYEIDKSIKKMQELSSKSLPSIQDTTYPRLGRRAIGGPVNKYEEYIVGEKGPELFVPTQSGNIIPNNRLGSRSSVDINLSFNGSEPVQLQGTQQSVEQLERLFNERRRYAG